MDTGSYTYKALSKKYDQFLAPSFEIKVGSTELVSGHVNVRNLEVEINADGTAGGCSFTIEGEFDVKTKKWNNALLSTIKVGEKLLVSGGYVKRKELFYGYVDDYSIDYPEDGPPRITVTGLDGLGFLMSLCEPIYAGQRKANEVVQTILNKSVSAGFAKKVTVGALSGFETPIIKEHVDHWKFLNTLAARYGATLAVIDGEMIFDTVLTSTSPLIKLTMGVGLHNFQKRVSLAKQVGKVEVWGRDVNQKPIKGVASSVSVGGKGKSAAELVSGLKNAVLREYNEYARTQEECKKLAENRLNGIAMGFVSGYGSCIGLPELIPGRYIEIDGADQQINGIYFVSKVRHIFGWNGYITEFEVRGAKA